MSKLLTKFLAAIFGLLLFVAGCAHTVYSVKVPNEISSAINAEVNPHCAGNCSIDNCWQETADITFCKVTFGSATDEEKKKFLLAASKALNAKGLKVGFCGEESGSAKLVAAFYRGPTSAVNSTSKDLLVNACVSAPN